MAKQKYSILYVDDEPTNLSVFKNLFRRDYIIHTAESGEEGLGILKKHDIQLVITDQRMPRMTGIQFIEKAKVQWPDLPYIILTGFTDHDALKDAVNEIGIYRYITKPFDTQYMSATLDSTLEVFQLRKDKDLLNNELRDSEEKLSKILGTSLEAIISIDDKQNIILANPAAEEMFGYDQSELLNKPLIMLLPKEARKEHSKLVNKFSHFEGKSKMMGERLQVYGIRSSGKTFPIETAISKMKIRGKYYFNAIIRDISNRVESERLLRESELKFKGVFNSMIDVFMRVDNDGIVNMISPSIYDLLGYKVDEVVGSEAFDSFADPEDRMKFKQLISENGYCHNFEGSAYTKDGQLKHLLINAKLLYDKNNKPLGIESLLRDVTSKKLIEDQLQLNTKVLNAAQQIASIGSWDWNILDDSEVWSDEQYRIFGFEPGKVAPTYNLFKDALHEDDRETVLAAVKDALKYDVPYELECRIVHPDGAERVINVKGKVYRDEDNNPVRMLGTSQDITIRKLHELELNRTKELLEKTYRLAGLGTWSLDVINNELYWDSITKSIHEVENDYVPELNAAINFYKEGTSRDTISGVVKSAMKKGGAWDLELEIITAKGNVRWVNAKGQCDFLNGEVTKLHGSIQDINSQKQADIALAKSEEKFKGVFNSMIDIFSRVNNEGIVELMSPSVYQILGFKAEELVGRKSNTMYANPKDRDRLIGLIQENGHCENFEAPVYTKEGEIKYLSFNSKMYTDAKGKPQGTESLVRDITQKRLVEIALKANTELLKEAQKIAHIGHLKWDIDSNEMEWSDEVYRMYGVSPDVKPDFDFTASLIHPDDFAGVQERLALAVQKVQNYNVEHRIIRADNQEIIWVHAQAKLEYDREGDLYSFIGTVQDITEKKRDEKALRESEEEFRILAESAPIFILKVDKNYKINYFNRSKEEIKRDIIGTKLFDLLPAPDHGRIKKVIRGVFKLKKSDQYEVQRLSPEGTMAWYSTTVGPIIKEGRVENVLLLSSDITIKKEAEHKISQLNEELEDRVFKRTAELEKAQEELALSLEKEKELGELKSRFVATASHQFRTPLTVIQSSMAILSMQKEGMNEAFKSKFEKVYNRIHAQISKMTELMNDVLILGKVNSGSISQELEATNLVALCEEVISSHNETQSDGRKLVFNVNGKNRTIDLDPKLMEQAISNLISNAFKYSAGKSAPELTIDFRKAGVQIVVRDAGMGIPSEDLKHIFDPFYRATNVEGVSGTGLGTAIAKEFVTLNGGTISVKSELNSGAEFKIEFEDK